MAYTPKNFLLRVKDVNEVYLEHKKRGATAEWIYKNQIEERFRLSRSTFFNYLTIPYKTLLKQIDEQEKNQLTIKFD